MSNVRTSPTAIRRPAFGGQASRPSPRHHEGESVEVEGAVVFATSDTDQCRVTIVGPRRELDVALPADIPLAYLMPTLLHRCGPELADEGGAHGGWALQRLGDPPLDIGRNLIDLGIRHGELLYLRPEQDLLRALDVDDVVDTVASATQELPGRWSRGSTRAFCLAASSAAALVGVGVLAAGAAPWTSTAVTALVATALLLGLASAHSRRAGDAAGGLLGAVAMPYAFVAGAAATAGDAPRLLGSGQLLAGSAAAALVSVVASVVCGGDRQWFLAGAIACAFGLAGAEFALPAGVDAADAAGIVLGLVLLGGPALPGLAARAAALQRPFVPTQASDLREQPPAPPADAVLHGVARADRYVVALSGTVASVSVVSAAVTLRQPGWGPSMLVALAMLVLALRARFFSSAVARWLLLCGAVALLGLLVFAWAARTGTVGDLCLVAATLAGTASGAWLAHRLSHSRPSPWWGRIGDIAEVAATVTVVPVCLQVAGVYDIVRALGG